MSTALSVTVLTAVAVIVYRRAVEVPTTNLVELVPPPKGCVETAEKPPAELMRIVELQRSHYHLASQKMIVCRVQYHVSMDEEGFRKWAFSEEMREKWRPVYVGCCTYSYQGHYLVVAAGNSTDGTAIIVQVAMVPVKRDYFALFRRR